MKDREFAMNSYMMQKVCRRGEIAGVTHVVCSTGEVDVPYAEFFFADGKWHFLRTLVYLPSSDFDGFARSR